MVKISKSSAKKTKKKIKKIIPVAKKVATQVKKVPIIKEKTKALIKISKNYMPKDTEKYMCDKHLSFFKKKTYRMEKRTCKSK